MSNAQRSNVIYPMKLAERKFKDHQCLAKAAGKYPVSKDQLNASFKKIELLTIIGLNDLSLKRQCRKDPYACNDIIFGMFDNAGGPNSDYAKAVSKQR